jgi:hypothetical protein
MSETCLYGQVFEHQAAKPLALEADPRSGGDAVSQLGRRGIQTDHVHLPPGLDRRIHLRFKDARMQAIRERPVQRGERPMQRYAPALTARRGVRIALKDAERDRFLARSGTNARLTAHDRSGTYLAQGLRENGTRDTPIRYVL